MKNVYQNVPGPGIEAIDAKNIKHHAIIRLITIFNININAFALLMFIKGFSLKIFALQSDRLNASYMKLYDKLVQSLINLMSHPENNSIPMVFNREELQMLIGVLKLRMSHCEKERDERNEAFNPDTYIGMKLLLIELKELLLGEIVEIGSPILESYGEYSSEGDRENRD